ncbi:MAG: CHAT domain-containing protein [Gloeomargarita sp. SKYG98]|nr:CHAT domain-containing protein [Gloeomargarita sp. SKYG98]
MRLRFWGAILAGFLALPGGVSWAQSITPANDGTGTQVQRFDNRYDISGGRQAGRNLFHSFGLFNLDPGHIANFLANPSLRNILARVTGGSASFINGLIQVTGGTPNLYLMNPAGILFGSQATLHVPAAFVATTANRIVFPGGSFSAYGPNDYSQLTGDPVGFGFDRKNPAAIINEGKLTVNPGQGVGLVGGQVINTGTIQAPGGTITIAAVPGENLVRLSVPGQVLSLEFHPQQLAQAVDDQGQLPVTRLPELLTGTQTLTPHADGTISVAGSNVRIPMQPGTAVVSGRVDVSAPDRPGGQVGIFSQRVALVRGEANASGETGGGHVLIGGEFQGRGPVPNAEYTFVDWDVILRADAINAGHGGRVIVWADKTTDFRGTITARGGQTAGDGGFVEVSGKENLRFTGRVDTSAPKGRPGTLLLDPENILVVAGTGANDSELLDNQILFSDAPGATFTIGASRLLEQLRSNSVFLQATNNIEFNTELSGSSEFPTTLFAEAGNNIDARGDILFSNIGINFDARNSISLRNLRAESVFLRTQGSTTIGNIASQGRVDIRTEGSITIGDISAGADVIVFSGFRNRDLSFRLAPGIGDRPIQIYESVNFSGRGGDIQVGNVTTSGDELWIATGRGSVRTGNLINTYDGPFLKYIDVYAPDLVETGFIDTRTPNGVGGDVWLLSRGDVRVTRTNSDGFSIDTRGSVRGGDILIRYGPGNQFTVGNAAINGTAGGITTGEFLVTPPQQFVGLQLGTQRPGTIQIGDPDESLLLKDLFALLFEILDFSLEDFGDFVLASPFVIAQALAAGDYGAIINLDNLFGSEFNRALGSKAINNLNTVDEVGEMLSRLAQETGKKPAIVYLMVDEQQLTIAALTPGSRAAKASSLVASTTLGVAQSNDQTQPIVRGLPEARRSQVIPVVERFLNTLRDPRLRTSDAYLKDAQQLYRWLIAPIEPELRARGIETLMFSLDSGLRLLPLAALHDGRQFLVEKYSLSLIPSVNLIDTRYRPLRNVPVLAMGADTFADQAPLPAVPVELQLITDIWPGRRFLNQEFTVERLTQERRQTGYPIVHLATHADFAPGRLENSYIEFGNNQRLLFPQLRRLPLREPNPVELLTLSACRTAVGDATAELGFAGLAVQTGAKSALASLWYVSDEGTLALMNEFYRNLQQAPIKAEALRQAQIALLRGQVVFKGGELRSVRGNVPVPPAIAQRGDQPLNHPYYWAGFTLIGSPW